LASGISRAKQTSAELPESLPHGIWLLGYGFNSLATGSFVGVPLLADSPCWTADETCCSREPDAAGASTGGRWDKDSEVEVDGELCWRFASVAPAAAGTLEFDTATDGLDGSVFSWTLMEVVCPLGMDSGAAAGTEILDGFLDESETAGAGFDDDSTDGWTETFVVVWVTADGFSAEESTAGTTATVGFSGRVLFCLTWFVVVFEVDLTGATSVVFSVDWAAALESVRSFDSLEVTDVSGVFVLLHPCIVESAKDAAMIVRTRIVGIKLQN